MIAVAVVLTAVVLVVVWVLRPWASESAVERVPLGNGAIVEIDVPAGWRVISGTNPYVDSDEHGIGLVPDADGRSYAGIWKDWGRFESGERADPIHLILIRDGGCGDQAPGTWEVAGFDRGQEGTSQVARWEADHKGMEDPARCIELNALDLDLRDPEVVAVPVARRLVDDRAVTVTAE